MIPEKREPLSPEEQIAQDIFSGYIRILNETRSVDKAQVAALVQLSELRDGMGEIVAQILSNKYDIETPLAEHSPAFIQIPRKIKQFLLSTFVSN